jgi:iron complex transport system substrate-binding protein
MKLQAKVTWGGIGLLLSLLIAAACNFHRPALLAWRSPISACRMIQHSVGKTCIPHDPQRIITLDTLSLESVLSLGVQPIASADASLNSSYLSKFTNLITNIGSDGQPSLEKVLFLKPDLILGADYLTSLYHQSAQIAPTVLTKFNHSGDWKQIFTVVGATLGRSQQAAKVMADYYQRLEVFKRQMGDRLQTTKVSIVYLYPDVITVYTTAGFNGSILKDAGLMRPASQDLDLESTQKKSGGMSPIQYSISNELFDAADGDVIFVIVTPTNPQIGKTRQRLLSDPMWSKLEAVKQGKVYEVLDYWIGSGPIAANLVIDDLFKYLLNTPPASANQAQSFVSQPASSQ